MITWSKIIILCAATVIIYYAESVKSAGLTNFQVVHFLDPSSQESIYYSSWNSDQWINWLRNKYTKESESSRYQNDPSSSNEGSPDNRDIKTELKGSWVNIIIPATEEDFKTAYASDSEHAYTDPQKSDYFWSDFAYPVYVIIRSPNATINITEEEASSNEEQETLRRTLYGYNVYNCVEKKMFVNAKLNIETLEPIHYQTFFPKKVKNPKEKLRIPLSVCSKVSQTRGLLDEIRFQLSNSQIL